MESYRFWIIRLDIDAELTLYGEIEARAGELPRELVQATDA